MRLSLPAELVLSGAYVSSVDHLENLPQLDPLELAWAAGFFDGEGCTYLGHSRNGTARFPVPCTEVNQIEPITIERFHAAVGRVGSCRVRPDKPERRRHEMHSFYTRNWRDTQAVVSALWPFLSKPKRHQAAEVFDAYRDAFKAHPRLGQPNISRLWSETACPLGHQDIYTYTAPSGRRYRRCRACRKEGTQQSYRGAR